MLKQVQHDEDEKEDLTAVSRAHHAGEMRPAGPS